MFFYCLNYFVNWRRFHVQCAVHGISLFCLSLFFYPFCFISLFCQETQSAWRWTKLRYENEHAILICSWIVVAAENVTSNKSWVERGWMEIDGDAVVEVRRAANNENLINDQNELKTAYRILFFFATSLSLLEREPKNVRYIHPFLRLGIITIMSRRKKEKNVIFRIEWTFSLVFLFSISFRFSSPLSAFHCVNKKRK